MGSAVGSPWRRARWLALAAAACLQNEIAAAQTRNDTLAIAYFETLHADAATGSAAFKATSPGLSFNAYGRQFELQLESNDRIASPALLQKAGSLRLMRGSLKNVPGSWARLSSVDGRLQGMIWDGSQLFMIEPAAAVRDMIVPPSVVAAGETVIFRLADTSIANGTLTCDSVSGGHSIDSGRAKPQSGQQAYDAMLQELKGRAVGMQAPSATKRLQISTIGDAAFRAQYSSDEEARQQILIRINEVDGIFSAAPLNVAIQATSVDVSAAATQGLSSSSEASTLLDSLALLRESSAELNSRGLTHLFTGRDLVRAGNTNDTTPVGIAFTRALCDKKFGVGLTEARMFNPGYEALITAHEIGHNFGAIHDGDPSKDGVPSAQACPAGQFLMSPSIVPNEQRFSQCSIDAIQPRIPLASCITDLPPADLAVPANLGTFHGPRTRAFDVFLPVTNVGGLTATGAEVEIVIPPSLVIDDASVPGGSCTSGAGTITCTLNPIDGGATQQIQMTLRGSTLGSNSVSAQITFAGDAQAANNSGDGTIVIDPQVDLAVALQAPASGVTNTSFATNFTVSNVGTNASGALTVDIALPAGVTASSAVAGSTACSIAANPVRCSLPSIAPNTSVSGSIALIASGAGSLVIGAQVTGAGDENAANDSAQATVSSGSPAPARKRGGGGDFGVLPMLALAAAAFARSRFSGTSQPQPL